MNDRVNVWIGTGFEAAWAVARPWLESAAREALLADLPWAVLLPTRAHAHALKARALEHSLNLGAVFFLTPGEARDRLQRQSNIAARLVPREHRILLLTSLMEELPSPIREPARLLRALDQLDAGGWVARDLGFAPAEQIADTYREALNAAAWSTVPQLDRSITAAGVHAAFHRLLILGFDAAHWDLANLLVAAAKSAAHRADLVFAAPRSKAEALDMAFIGTFEEHFGAAMPVDVDSETGPFASLSRRMENPTIPLSGHDPRPIFLLGRTMRDQAEAVVARARAFACEPDAARIGIVVPGPGPLAREIAAGLQRHGVPHFDAFGQRPPPDGATRRWRVWTAFQRAPTLASLVRLMAEQPERAHAALMAELDRAFSEMMVDDLSVLRARLLAINRPESRIAAGALDRYASLPTRATLFDFAESTERAWKTLGWEDLLPPFHARRSDIAVLSDRVVAASAWLDWLDAVAPDRAPVRTADAANPLACIHLLGYAQAEGQPWTHLILTGLNEGEWPPPADTTGLLSDDRIAELNRAALKQGRYGEGHLTAQPLKTLILGSAERREILRRQFYNLVETPTRGLAACCALEREDGSGRLAPAGDFLSHLYFSATDQPLTEAEMRSLYARTRAWIARMPAAHALEPPSQPTPLSCVRAAWTARRAATPFGPYDCAFSGPPPATPILSCRAWEEAVRDPLGRWFETFLRASPPPDWEGDDPWPKTQGMWIHRWLAKALCEARNRFEVRRAGPVLVDRTREAAKQTRDALAAVFRAGGRAEPQWWRAHLAQAEWMAVAFAQRLADIEGWPVAAVEWRLDRGIEIALPGGRLHTHGFIDALFAQTMPAGGVPETAWILDFKTGKESRLTDKNFGRLLCKGHGIQISLYAFALAALGARDVQVSLLTANDAAEPQLPLATLRGEEQFWRGLLRMQETGVFGIRGAVRAEYGPSLDVPLATLPVDPDRLEEKWALTHPDLVGAEDVDA